MLTAWYGLYSTDNRVFLSGSIVDEIEETYDIRCNEADTTHHYPMNYETCATFLSLLKSTCAWLILFHLLLNFHFLYLSTLCDDVWIVDTFIYHTLWTYIIIFIISYCLLYLSSSTNFFPEKLNASISFTLCYSNSKRWQRCKQWWRE